MPLFDLRHRRQKKGLSIRALERASGVNRGILSVIETDKLEEVLKAASKAMGEPIELTIRFDGTEGDDD